MGLADARPNYTDANPIFTGGAARHRDALRRAGPSASAAAPYLKHVRDACRRGSIASRMRKFPEVKADTYRADRTRPAA